jgi:hypothetical protein
VYVVVIVDEMACLLYSSGRLEMDDAAMVKVNGG